MTLNDVDRLYEVAGRLSVTRVVVPEADVDEFTLATRQLERYLGAEAAEEPWLSGLAPLRRARWLMHTVPLPTAHPALGLDALAARLQNSGRLLTSGGSAELRHWFETSLTGLQLLSDHDYVGLADAVAEALQDGVDETACVVVLNAPFLSPVKEYFAGQSLRLDRVLTPSGLRQHPTHESQLVVGASRHYPDWLWTAPRAEVISVFHRSSTTDRVDVPAALPVGGQPPIRIRGDRQSRLVAEAFVVEPPPINWSTLQRNTRGATRPEDVKARAYLLADQRAVLLETSDGATTFVVDPQGATGEVIGKVPTSAIEVGSFLLLRESFGDEDATVQLANKLLGGRAMTLRGYQKRWKEALRASVLRDGIPTAYKRLGALGCRARNLPRWLGPDAIRTQSIWDFKAICAYGGLVEQEAVSLWGAMGEIASAHIRAGREMRELLEKRLNKTDLSPLMTEGRLTINLPELDAGALGIFRVEARNEEICMVNPRELRVATKVGTI